ncbi:carbohydrate kinase family protein, partial [Candidatus Bathyarchaeota archaeon]|nr:carbohydrate kinase family protein [Candidatus Bathyarchaeota archaeon]
LFALYIENIAKLCTNYKIEPEIFESTINKAFIKMMEGTKRPLPSKSRVLIYGSAAVDMIGTIDTMPKIDEVKYLADVQKFPGGSAANVAIGLRRLGVPVSFVGKLGGDAEGTLLLKEFLEEGVDVSGIIIEPEKRTVTTFIAVDPSGNKRIFVLGGDNIALTISLPSEVDWKKIEENEIIYIGEVFVEVAELIASFAKSRRKKVIYRPGTSLITFNPEKVRTTLRNVDVLILNNQGWEALKKYSNENPIDITKIGPTIVIITKGSKGCEAYTDNESFKIPAFIVNTFDTTGAGDAFTVGLVSAFLDSKNLKESINEALKVSAIKVMKKGARTALPTKNEVKEFTKYLLKNRKE